MKKRCGWRRFGIMRSHWVRLLGLALLLMVPAGVWPQDMLPLDVVPQSTEAGPRGLPSGLRINSVSAWVTRDYLLAPSSAGTATESYILGYGGALDTALYLPGKTGAASLAYSLGYNGNTTYSQSNGLDQRLSFSWARRLTRTLSLSVTGGGESVTVQGFLFEPITSPTADLSNTSALPGTLTPTAVAGATNSVLYPGRHQTATMAATMTYSSSRRLNWSVNLHGQRLLPSTSVDSITQERLGYPGETGGGVSFGLSYSLSRRTSFGADIGYFRNVFPLGTTQAGSGGLSVTRVLGRRWFGSAMAGFGLGDFTNTSRTTAHRLDFTGRAALGTSFEAHILSLSVSQSIGDSYGFGAQRTFESNLAWVWRRTRRQNWSLQGAAAYERLTGMQVYEVQSAVLRGSLTRRLTTRLSCTAEAGYAWAIGQATNFNLARQAQNSMRFSLVWHPSWTLW